MNALAKIGAAASAVALGCTLSACGPTSYFQGSWYRHGIAMSVDAAGNGTVSYRVYRWCGPGVAAPCDSIVGNTIVNGGRATFKLTSPLDATTGTGVITGGNEVRAGRRVTLAPIRTLNGKPSVLNATGVGPWSGPLTFCGSQYVTACGA